MELALPVGLGAWFGGVLRVESRRGLQRRGGRPSFGSRSPGMG